MRLVESEIFTDWTPSNAALWGHAPQCLGHRLHEHELFTNEALASLLDKYPKSLYNLVQWTEHGSRRDWREGELGDITGQQAIEAIAKGHVWINLRQVGTVDPRYGELLDSVFEELARKVKGFESFSRQIGILISSPLSKTHYHADLPGQSLWQIRGQKRVYIYPPSPPFLTPQHVEGISLSGVEVGMPYEPWYDEHAKTFVLKPGQMLHWQLNAPHRVENLDCLNVSMTTEYFTDEIRRHQIVMRANGILRHKFGLKPRSLEKHGPGFWSKAVFQRALKNTKMVRKENRAKREPEFRLDPANPGSLIDIRRAS